MSFFRGAYLDATAAYRLFLRRPIRILFDLMLRVAGGQYIIESGYRAHMGDLTTFAIATLLMIFIARFSDAAWKWCDDEPFFRGRSID
jgi:hypothetical protein